MRFLLLVLVLCSVIPVHAQGDEPLYIQCGAEEYMIERYYILALATESQIALREEGNDLPDLGAHMIATMQIRDLLMEMEDIPECVENLHKLTIRRAIIMIDYEAFAFASSAIFVGNSDFAFLAGQKSGELTAIDEQVTAEVIDLGWVTEDLEYTNEPPTVTPAPTKEE